MKTSAFILKSSNFSVEQPVIQTRATTIHMSNVHIVRIALEENKVENPKFSHFELFLLCITVEGELIFLTKMVNT